MSHNFRKCQEGSYLRYGFVTIYVISTLSVLSLCLPLRILGKHTVISRRVLRKGTPCLCNKFSCRWTSRVKVSSVRRSRHPNFSVAHRKYWGSIEYWMALDLSLIRLHAYFPYYRSPLTSESLAINIWMESNVFGGSYFCGINKGLY